jgi:hypothetical protein
MRLSSRLRPAFVLFVSLWLNSSSVLAAEQNTLTPAEQSEGWKLLFDGKTTKGWRGFKKDSFPQKGWEIHDGILQCVANARGGDIITDELFDNFELSWEWMVPKGANNGVKYFITEDRAQATGHEYQMIDDPNSGESKDGGKHSTAAFYDVLPPSKDKPAKPAGEWNQSRVLVKGNHVEHWLNGQKVLEYELGSPEVMEAIAHSKFKGVPRFGTHIKGHILLTEHHDQANYRNIKIRPLDFSPD